MIQEEDTSKFLEEATPWEKLSPSAQAYFGTPAQFQQRILHFYFDHQKAHESALVFISASQYYQQLIEFGINNFLVFPYHLIKALQKYNPITPFTYYTEMLFRVMQSDKSYPSIPNFSATDAYRVTGVGRNEYIETMNKSRSGGWPSILKSKEKVLRSLLPQEPKAIKYQNWWRLDVVPANENRLSKLSAAQKATYDKISAGGGNATYGDFNAPEVQALYNDNLLYITIPLESTDTIELLPLDNLVMNRIGGDYLEGLCYKSFISIGDRTTVEQLAKMLAVDVSEIAKVLSLFIRFGLAQRVSADEGGEAPTEEGARKLAVIYDANLPAVLMLGNLGDTIKSYAVTLYEAGKILDKTLTEFISALLDVEKPTEPSMVASYDSCQIVARIGQFLKNQKLGAAGVDFNQLESLLALDATSRTKLFERNYAAAVAMAPLNLTQSSLEIPGLVHFGPPSAQFHSPWLTLYLNSVTRRGPPVFVWPQGEIVTSLPEPFFEYDTVRLFKWGNDAVVVPTTTLLISLNDALPSSPVLVQGFERAGEKMEDVGFPLAEDAADAELEAAFALGSMFGFVKYVVREDGSRTAIDLLYGIPTTTPELCDAVLAKIEARNMLGEENISAMTADSARIATALAEFVATWSCGVGTPVRALCSIGDTIKWL